VPVFIRIFYGSEVRECQVLVRSDPSLEKLIEIVDLGLEVLHPGGLEITRELAVLCNIRKNTKVLDVASGSGESACFLQANFGAQVIGIDASKQMVERARKKAAERNLPIQFKKADAHNLPFEDDTFDAVISECTVCLLEKGRAVREMTRVVKPGGYVGLHDICWKDNTPESLKQRLAEIEGERPETLDGWKTLFEEAGLDDLRAADKSHLISAWTKSTKKELGITGWIKVVFEIIHLWGIKGLRRILESEEILESEYTGYGIIVGRKPPAILYA
jgi:ubiquinone/menaquinone biosynthesis C-methylase UbiE